MEALIGFTALILFFLFVIALGATIVAALVYSLKG